MGTPLRVLTWHVHGSYLNYLSHVPVTWLLPVRPDRRAGYGGRGDTFTWPDSVVEVPAGEVGGLDVDVVLTQSRANWEVDRHQLLGARVAELPRVHVEHDPPATWPNDALHPVQDEQALLVHVTEFNRLMWDSGRTPSTVVEHGVAVPDVPWTGEQARGVAVVNNLWTRGRRLGPDVLERVAQDVPVDLAGMGGERFPGWLGDVRLDDLHHRLGTYRCFVNPIRYTSLGLAVCEAMALGLPVVGLATTEMATAVRNGVNGYVETDVERLVGHARRLVRDRDEAAELSTGARRVAQQRFGIDRFAADWSRVLHAQAGRAP
ncbi:MAG: hypothetical protein JWN08_2691 [Frankiales bacterium]|nr:hypothetical protein [Frankiales bacterium]